MTIGVGEIDQRAMNPQGQYKIRQESAMATATNTIEKNKAKCIQIVFPDVFLVRDFFKYSMFSVYLLWFDTIPGGNFESHETSLRLRSLISFINSKLPKAKMPERRSQIKVEILKSEFASLPSNISTSTYLRNRLSYAGVPIDPESGALFYGQITCEECEYENSHICKWSNI